MSSPPSSPRAPTSPYDTPSSSPRLETSAEEASPKAAPSAKAETSSSDVDLEEEAAAVSDVDPEEEAAGFLQADSEGGDTANLGIRGPLLGEMLSLSSTLDTITF